MNPGERAIAGQPPKEAGPGPWTSSGPGASSEGGYRLIAPLYDLIFGAALQHGRRVAVAALQCKPGERVLELCIGSGLSLPLYPKNVHIVGIDFSADMLKKSAQRLGSIDAGVSCDLLQMSAERLAFADGTFDKAVVLFAVSGLPDPVHALRALRRVCRPGATIVIANRFRSGPRWLRFFDVLLSPLYELLRYRSDIDRDELLRRSGLGLVEAQPVNALGYSTVLTCRAP